MLQFNRWWIQVQSTRDYLQITLLISVLLVYWQFSVTFNVISIYVMAHRCAGGLKNEIDLPSRLPRHRHYVWFFKVPIRHRHQAILSVFPRLDHSIAQLDSNSQHVSVILMPYVSHDRDNGQTYCANGLHVLRHAQGYRGLVLLQPWVRTCSSSVFHLIVLIIFGWLIR